MENIPTVLEKSVRTKKERKLLILIPIILSIIAISFFVIISNMKSNFISVPLSQTVGINVSQDFSFTLSPNGRWIVYFEEKYPYYDQFNLFAFDTLNNKKFAIDVGDVNTGALQLQIKNNCWSKDSRYCILPVGELVNSPSIIERKKAITVPDNSPWLIGKQLAESEFTETGGSVGYLNNGPDVLIDFSGTAPVFKKQYFDSNLIDIFSKNKNVKEQTDRLTFDEISPDGFSCSDCLSAENKEKDFGGDSHGLELFSPDGRFIAQQISHGTDFVTPPNLYVIDIKTGNKTFIAKNVYYDMHFTTDSSKLYYYSCKSGGACDKNIDHLFYVDLINKQGFFDKVSNIFKNKKTEEVVVPIVVHTPKQEAQDLEKIQQKVVDDSKSVLKEHYDLLVQKFKTPQKIIGVNSVRLITQDSYRVIFTPKDVPMGNKKDMEATNLANSLIDKKVTIVLPTFEEFIKTYGGGDNYDVSFFGKDVWAYDANGKAVSDVPDPVDPVYKKYFGDIYAKVYYNGILLNDKFK